MLANLVKKLGVKDGRTVLAHCQRLGIDLVEASNNIAELKASIAHTAKRPDARKLAKDLKGKPKDSRK
jgi:hypothetical protein